MSAELGLFFGWTGFFLSGLADGSLVWVRGLVFELSPPVVEDGDCWDCLVVACKEGSEILDRGQSEVQSEDLDVRCVLA